MPELVQEGLRFLLEVAFIKEEQSAPANYYIGLATDADIAEADNLAALTEITGTNYARIAVPSSAVGFSTSESAGSDDWLVAIEPVVFTGDVAGDWQEAFSVFLATTSDGAGKLIAGGALAAGRTLASENDTLTIDLAIQLNG